MNRYQNLPEMFRFDDDSKQAIATPRALDLTLIREAILAGVAASRQLGRVHPKLLEAWDALAEHGLLNPEDWKGNKHE